MDGEEMTMAPQRLGVKWFCSEGVSVSPETLIPVYHRWIREKRLEGLMIDVADYAHVPDGPGVMLIGHEADYSLDEGVGGSLGLLAVRKRIGSGSLGEALVATCRLGVAVVVALEAEDLGIQISMARCRVMLLDRLRYPTGSEVIQEASEQITEALKGFVGTGLAIELVRDDPRGPAAFDVTFESAPSVAELAERSGAAAG
jgi:hypothetical protein